MHWWGEAEAEETMRNCTTAKGSNGAIDLVLVVYLISVPYPQPVIMVRHNMAFLKPYANPLGSSNSENKESRHLCLLKLTILRMAAFECSAAVAISSRDSVQKRKRESTLLTQPYCTVSPPKPNAERPQVHLNLCKNKIQLIPRILPLIPVSCGGTQNCILPLLEINKRRPCTKSSPLNGTN